MTNTNPNPNVPEKHEILSIEDYRDWVKNQIFGKFGNEDIIPENLIYPAMALGEVGEFQDLVKKCMRHGFLNTNGSLKNSYVAKTEVFAKILEMREKMILELGDIIHYWCRCCIALDVEPEDVVRKNVDKINKRFEDGTFKR